MTNSSNVDNTTGETYLDLVSEAKALVDALAQHGTPPDTEDLRRLILAPGNEDVPPPLAHEAASRITGRGHAVIPPLVTALWPVLKDLARAGEIRAVTLLCVLRAFLGRRMTQNEVSRLHLGAWPEMTLAEIGLTCSVMFDTNAGGFNSNRADLLRRYPDHAASNAAGLAPSRRLILEWLSGQDHTNRSSIATMAQDWDALSPHDRAALRTLALRHGADAVPLDEVSLEDNEAYERLSQTVAGGRPDVDPGRLATRLISARVWQAAEAVRTFAPALHLGRRAPRVALCISGQLRGWRATWPTWQTRLLPGAEVTVFVHSWPAIGRAGAEPFRQVLPFEGTRFGVLWREIARAEGMEAMRTALPSLFAALAESGRVTAAEVAEVYETDHVVLDDEEASPFAAMTNQEKMHAKIHAADAMARAEGEFDLHLRIRPDLPVRLRAFGWRRLAAAARASILWAEKPYGVHYGNLMMGDQFALGAPGPMAVYSNTWETFPKVARARLMHCPDVFTGHVSLAMCTWVHGIQVARAPVRFDPLRDAAPMPLSQIISALEVDAHGGGPARPLITAAYADQVAAK